MANMTMKRVMQEIAELQRDSPDDFVAEPSGSDLLDWHFTILGPPGTAFEGGMYHGRLVLPPDYPNKPPEIYFLTVCAPADVSQCAAKWSV
jgi:ubiquitin-conjugating enzyme E2 J1